MVYRHACVINKEGFYREFVLIVDGSVQGYDLLNGETLVNMFVPSGFIKPRWNGSEWIEGATVEEIAMTLPTIDELKATKKAEIANVRWQSETGGLKLNGFVIATDRESQSMITSAFASAIFDSTYTVHWKMANGWVDLDAQAIISVAQAVRDHVQACFNKEAKIGAAIETCDTAEDIHTIKWGD